MKPCEGANKIMKLIKIMIMCRYSVGVRCFIFIVTIA